MLKVVIFCEKIDFGSILESKFITKVQQPTIKILKPYFLPPAHFPNCQF